MERKTQPHKHSGEIKGKPLIWRCLHHCVCVLPFWNVGRFYAMAGSFCLEWSPLFFQEFHPREKKQGGENVRSCLVCCDRRKFGVWTNGLFFIIWVSAVIKGGERDGGDAERDVSCRAKLRERNSVRLGWKGSMEKIGRDIKTETNTVCLLLMCYWDDKCCMPARHPEAQNPVFTSQIRPNVHKLFRWCSLHNGCFTQYSMLSIMLALLGEMRFEG